MKKILFITFFMMLCLLALTPIFPVRHAEAAEPKLTLEFDPDGSIAPGSMVYLKMINQTSSEVKVKAVDILATVSPASGITIDFDRSFPSGWTWNLNNYNSTTGSLRLTGSGPVVSVPAEGEANIAKFAFTLTSDVSISIDESTVLTEDGTSENVFDSNNQIEAQDFTLMEEITPTPPTVATTAPSGLASTGPAKTIILAFTIAFGLVSFFFFVRRVIKAWKLSI